MEDLIRRIIKEEVSNRRQEKLMDLIKTLGVTKASKAVGGIHNLFRILDINSPMDFLHLFDDLDAIERPDDPGFLDFYWPKYDRRLMVYNKYNNEVYISEINIYEILNREFGIYVEVKPLLSDWLKTSYGFNDNIKIERVNL